MWHSNYDDPTDKEVEENVKSFLTRRRKWRQMSQMLKSCDSHQMTGIFLDVSKKGYINRAVKLIVSYIYPPNESLSFVSPRKIHNPVKYIWSSQGRCVTAREKGSDFSPKKKQRKKRMRKKRKRKKIKTEDNDCATTNSTGHIPVTSVTSDENDDFDGESSSDEDDEKSNWVRPPRKVSRNLRYLYTDVYFEKRHSKNRCVHMNNCLEDIVLSPNNKSKYCQRRAEIFMLNSAKIDRYRDDCGEDYIAYSTVPPLTLGEFLTAAIPTNSSKNLSVLDNIEIDEGNMHLVKSSENTHILGDYDKTNTARDEDDTSVEKYPTTPLKEKTDFERDSEIKEKLLPTADETVNSRTIGHNKDPLNENKNVHFPSVILLSRHLTRPDILRKDFKLNYKEAQCKPRRFLVNISHLAYQHIVLKGVVPLQVIPKLDLSLYLIFTFVKEARDNADEYRIFINTSLPLRNLKDAIVPLCQGKVISIHEVMQQTVVTLDSMDVNQIQQKNPSNLHDNVDYKATHSFNSLTAALKWNMKIFDHPHALEWAEDLSSKGFMRLLESNPGQRVLAHALCNDIVSSAQAKDRNVYKQGPHKPSICGICLQDFNEDKFSFPIALCVCSHWFCETCWKAKCYTALNKNCQLICLEDGCTSPVDSASLLSLLPLQVVRRYELQKLNNAIENIAHTRLCSNLTCNKIIFAKNQAPNDISQVINVTCSCYYQTCFFCSLSPHWPLSCAIAKIYQRRLQALEHDKFKQFLEDKELPDIVLKGQSCPSCGEINQANFQFSGVKTCSCGNVFCWTCGKDLSRSQEQHVSCTQKFQNEDKKLKQRLNTQDRYWVKNGEITRWYKVALHHRQLQHPQVVTILYKMADTVAEAIGEIASKGRHVGNVRQAALGWKNSFRKFAEKKLEFLEHSQSHHPTLDIKGSKIENDTGHDRFDGDLPETPRLISSLSSTDSLQTDRHGYSETLTDSPVPSTPISKYDPILKKAVLNIVNSKLELHHIIEHVAVFLEYSHTLNQPGKVIRSLERAEDMCTCLDMLLQPTHHEGCSRIISSFLRLRIQIMNVLTTLQNNLRQK